MTTTTHLSGCTFAALDLRGACPSCDGTTGAPEDCGGVHDWRHEGACVRCGTPDGAAPLNVACPDWCTASEDDHDEWAFETDGHLHRVHESKLGEIPPHPFEGESIGVVILAEDVLEVTVDTLTLRRAGVPTVELRGPESALLTSAGARQLAALLTRAAVLVEGTPGPSAPAEGCAPWCVDHVDADANNPAACRGRQDVDIDASAHLDGAEHLAVIPYAATDGHRHVEVCAFDPWGDVLSMLAPEQARALGLALVEAADMLNG